MVLPTRKTRFSLIDQNTGTSPLHQEAYTTHGANLSHWGLTPKTTGTMKLQPVKRRPKHRVKQNEKTEKQKTKEEGKNSPDQINEEEIGSLPEKEFREMIVKMIQNLGNRMEKIQETFNKNLEELRSKQ